MMQKMTELYAAHDEKRRALAELKQKIEKHEAIIEKHQNAIHRIEKKYDELWNSFSWVSMLIDPLAEALKEYFGAAQLEIHGPFGLRGNITIWIRIGKSCGSIVLTCCEKWRLYYDTGEKRPGYEEGSIGELNGFNNITAPLPDTIPEIAKLLHWYEAETEKQK